jgi:hypothetical protein
MAREYRRIVPGHTLEGKSTVLDDSPVPLLEADSPAGPRQEDRAGAASAVIWTTRGPVDNDDPSDTAVRKVGTAQDDGTVFKIVRYAPGTAPRHHRTNSIDYALVMSGSIDMELDDPESKAQPPLAYAPAFTESGPELDVTATAGYRGQGAVSPSAGPPSATPLPRPSGCSVSMGSDMPTVSVGIPIRSEILVPSRPHPVLDLLVELLELLPDLGLGPAHDLLADARP